MAERKRWTKLESQIYEIIMQMDPDEMNHTLYTILTLMEEA